MTTHLVKSRRFEDALLVIEHVTPRMIEERFLEELARVQAAKIACLAHIETPASDIDAVGTALRATFAEIDAPRITADTLLYLGQILPPEKGPPDGIPLLEEARDMFADMPIVAKEARCLEAMGDVLSARGEPEEARPHYRAARDVLERHGLSLRLPLLGKKLGEVQA